MWPCFYNASVLHVVNMKSRRTEVFFVVVFVKNDANHL